MKPVELTPFDVLLIVGALGHTLQSVNGIDAVYVTKLVKKLRSSMTAEEESIALGEPENRSKP